MSDPTVTVILPVYNGENYVRFAIESVLNQTLKHLELVVVDDGSTDSTPEILASYGPPLRYVRQENTGVAGAFNHGLRLARPGRRNRWTPEQIPRRGLATVASRCGSFLKVRRFRTRTG